mgnify:CR=1 FL=1
MGNKIIDFSYRVRGDFSPNGLQKVFFSFYPGDTVRMEKIADDILDISNCAVWYHTDSLTADDIDLDDLGMKLQEMKRDLADTVVTEGTGALSSITREDLIRMLDEDV